MKIEINSLEYQCWHEVGHAMTCLALGGKVEDIQFVDEASSKGIARARCETTQEIRQHVACGGFATEYVLSRNGYLYQINDREFTQIVFKNATHDREMFLNKTLQPSDEFTKEEDTRFMDFAINRVAPIIRNHLQLMDEVVGELMVSKVITGERMKEVINNITIKSTGRKISLLFNSNGSVVHAISRRRRLSKR